MASIKLELISSVITKLSVSEQHFPEARVPRELISSDTWKKKTRGVRPDPVLCQNKEAFLESIALAKPAQTTH